MLAVLEAPAVETVCVIPGTPLMELIQEVTASPPPYGRYAGDSRSNWRQRGHVCRSRQHRVRSSATLRLAGGAA